MAEEELNPEDEADSKLADQVEGPDPRSAVENWSIVAVGHQPAYYLARDFIFGSLFRDPRPRWFHARASKPAGWMHDMVGHLPENHQRPALLHLALDYLHHWHLARLFGTIGYGITSDMDTAALAGGRPDERLLSRLWHCPGYGVLLDRNDDTPWRKQVCNMPWLCPWCVCRQVVELYHGLQQGLNLQTGGRNRYLLLARAIVFREQLGIAPGVTLARDEIAQVRGHVRNHWSRLATKHSINGGLMTYQVGPDLYEGEKSYRHEVGLLGEMVIGSDAGLARVREWIGADAGPGPVLHLNGADIPVRCWLLPADDRALRILLAGSSHGYPAYQHFLSATRDPEAGFEPTQDGIPGVLSLQPTFMFEPDRWTAYAQAIKGVRMWDAFGLWKSALRQGRRALDEEKDLFVPIAREELPRLRRRRCLRQANRQRHALAEQRLAELLAVATPLWAQLREEGGDGRRGRPPVQRRLKELLLAQGIAVQDWDLRRLMKMFRQGAVGTVAEESSTVIAG